MKIQSKMLSIRTIFAGLALMSVSVASVAHEYKLGDLEIIHPYATPTPPGVSMAAGYMEIKNHGDSDDRLVGGKVNFAHELQLHETTHENDVSRMRRLEDGVLIPAGESVHIMPMGTHVMFTDLSEPLVEGARHEVTLTFEKAGDLQVEFSIEVPESGEVHDMSSMDDMPKDSMNHEEMKGDMKHEAEKHH